ncbi:hypothetical protein GHT09_007550 [Marmota monax]|uniref:Uncharacterized protein n=1 Tax=Marmota monax TaxID=9995 RepID=A0A834PRH5_MARMO|nr:hypothetical protein GHT09_007550 [Marmota monax]
MASSASAASDDGGRKKPRLAASLQISPGPSPWRPSAGLGQDAWGPPRAAGAEADAEGGAQAAGRGAGVGEPGPARAREDPEVRPGGFPRVLGPAGDFPTAARPLSLPLRDPPPSQAVASLAQYAAGLGVSLTFREDPVAGEAQPGRAVGGATGSWGSRATAHPPQVKQERVGGPDPSPGLQVDPRKQQDQPQQTSGRGKVLAGEYYPHLMPRSLRDMPQDTQPICTPFKGPVLQFHLPCQYCRFLK